MGEPWSFHSSPLFGGGSSTESSGLGYDDNWTDTDGTNSSYIWDRFHETVGTEDCEPVLEIPLDQIVRYAPFPVWHFNILARLDTEDLLNMLVAIQPHRPSCAHDRYTFEMLQKSIVHKHLLKSIRHTSLETLLSTCQQHFAGTEHYHVYEERRAKMIQNSLKYRTRAGSGEKRKMLEWEEDCRQGKARKLREEWAFGWLGMERQEKLGFEILERMVSQVFMEMNLDQKKYPIFTKCLTAFILEAPESMGLIFIKDLKVVLPDSYNSPCADLQSYLTEVARDFRDLYTISCIILKVIYSFATRQVRIRVADPSDVVEPDAPEDADYYEFLNVDDGWDEDFWDEKATWEYSNYWHALANRPEVDTKVLMANGICSKMDLASAIYHAPTHTIEMYALENIQVFFHFADEFEVDWRFVGYAVMGSGRTTFHTSKVTLSMYDYHQPHRSHPRDPYLGYSKMIQELHFCSQIEQVSLIGFSLPTHKATELFGSLPRLERIRHPRGIYHRCILLAPQVPDQKKRYNLRQNVDSRRQRKSRGATF